MKVNDVYDYLNEIAPFNTQEEWDNSGLLIGDANSEVNGIIVSLDITNTVIEEAINTKCNLIITHHPVIFKPLRSILVSDEVSKNIVDLVKSNISVISAHTNLDKALINDVLISKLCVENASKIDDYLRIGYLKNKVVLDDYISIIKNELHNTTVRFYNSGKPVHKVGCVSGAGCDWLKKAFDFGCDTFITSDIKHHEWLEAKSLGINLIDADHYNTENCAMPFLCNLLINNFTDQRIFISNNNKQVICYG